MERKERDGKEIKMKLAASYLKLSEQVKTQSVAGVPDAVAHQGSRPMKREHYGIWLIKLYLMYYKTSVVHLQVGSICDTFQKQLH